MSEWTPTDNQKAALKIAREQDFKCSITAMCDEIGISRQAYYLWFDNPEFCAWWKNGWERHFSQKLPEVLAALTNTATGEGPGNPTAARILLERFDEGYAPKSRKELSGEVGVSWWDLLDDEGEEK